MDMVAIRYIILNTYTKANDVGKKRNVVDIYLVVKRKSTSLANERKTGIYHNSCPNIHMKLNADNNEARSSPTLTVE